MILHATQIKRPNFPTKRLAKRQRSGIVFQNRFTKALEKNLPGDIGSIPEPWFSYADTKSKSENKWGICSPDIVLVDTENKFILVIEVKTTWTPEALEKLKTLYCPVVARAFGFPTKPLVVCKNLTPESPRPQPTISFALLSQNPLYQWLGTEPIRW